MKKRDLTDLFGVFAVPEDHPFRKRVRELAARYSGQDFVRELKKLEREAAIDAAVERDRRVQRVRPRGSEQ